MSEQKTIKDLYVNLIRHTKNINVFFNSILKQFIAEIMGEGIYIEKNSENKYIYLHFFKKDIFHTSYFCIFSVNKDANELIEEIFDQKYIGDDSVDIDFYVMLHLGNSKDLSEENIRLLRSKKIKFKYMTSENFVDEIIEYSPSIFNKFREEYFTLPTEEYTSIITSFNNNIFIIESQSDRTLKNELFPFILPKQTFIKNIGREPFSLLLERLKIVKEKCGRGITNEDCENCGRNFEKICITKLFAYHLSLDILPHCGAELADSYWISENKGYAIVIKGANMRTKNQYSDPLIQINDLSQRTTINTIFFANTKPTSNLFLIQVLNICKALSKRFLVINKDELAQLLFFYEKNTSLFEKLRSIEKLSDIKEIISLFSTTLKDYKNYMEELILSKKFTKFNEIQNLIQQFIIQYFQDNDYKIISSFISEYLDNIIYLVSQYRGVEQKFIFPCILNALHLFNIAIQKKQEATPLSINLEVDISLKGLETPDPVAELFGSILHLLVDLPEKLESFKKEPKLVNIISYLFAFYYETIYQTFELRSFKRFFNITIYPYFKEFLEKFFSTAIQDTQLEDKIFFLLTPYLTIDRFFNALADSQFKFLSLASKSKEEIFYEEIIDNFYNLFLIFFNNIPIFYHKELDYQKYLGFLIRPFWFPSLFYKYRQIHNLGKVRNNLFSFLDLCKNNEYIRRNALLHYSFRYFYQFLKILIERNYQFLELFYSKSTDNHLKIHENILIFLWEIHKFWLNYAKEYPELERIDDDKLLLEFSTRGLLRTEKLLRSEYTLYLNYVKKCFELYLNIKNESISNQNIIELYRFHEIFENLLFLIVENIPDDIRDDIEELINESILKMDNVELRSLYHHFSNNIERGYYMHIDKIKTEDEESSVIVWKTLGDDNEPLQESAEEKINEIIIIPIKERIPDVVNEVNDEDDLW